MTQIKRINEMSHEQLCKAWRFGPKSVGIDELSAEGQKVLIKRLFDDFGGFTPEISKRIGW